MQKFFFFIFAVLNACLFDGNIVDPHDQNLDPLVSFNGTTVQDLMDNVTGDSLKISRDKLQNFTNPKVSLVWQFIGFTNQISHQNTSTVEVEQPYNFSGNIFNPPHEEVLLSNEAAIGQ